jgi:hypothetical protein
MPWQTNTTCDVQLQLRPTRQMVAPRPPPHIGTTLKHTAAFPHCEVLEPERDPTLLSRQRADR